MPSRPSTPYRWATTGGARLAPTLARQGTGWVAGEPIDPLQCNDIWGTLSDWVDYLADVIPASNVIEAETFRVVDPAGPTTRGALTWTTIGGNAGLVVGGNAGGSPGIFFDNVTGYAKILQATGPVIMLEVRPTGMVGPRGVVDSRGIRFGYDTTARASLDHDFGPETGGWSDYWNVASGERSSLFQSGAFTFVLATAAGTPYDCAHRIRVQVAAETAQSSGFVEIETLAATFFGTAGDLEVSLIEITRSTGAETVLGTITSAAPIETFAGGHVVDPDTKRYCLEIRANALSVTTTDGVRGIRLICAYEALNPSV